MSFNYLQESCLIDEEGINKTLDELDALLNNTKYAKQKRTLKDDLIKFLNKMNPPKDLSTAYPSDVRLFLVLKEKDGKTNVHRSGCAFISKKQKNQNVIVL